MKKLKSILFILLTMLLITVNADEDVDIHNNDNQFIVKLDTINVIPCDDNNIYTENDTMINDICMGIPIQDKGDKIVRCRNLSISSTFKLNNNTYTVVDNETIKNRKLDYKYVCTTNVTNMDNLFSRTLFNEDISKWDVSNVNSMQFMFAFANDFNQPLGNWDTSSVLNMYGMFYKAYSFNQPINNWDVTNVEDMSDMFAYTNFNQELDGWNLIKLKEMNSMFYASKFNKSIKNWYLPELKYKPRLFNFHGEMWEYHKPTILN